MYPDDARTIRLTVKYFKEFFIDKSLKNKTVYRAKLSYIDIPILIVTNMNTIVYYKLTCAIQNIDYLYFTILSLILKVKRQKMT